MDGLIVQPTLHKRQTSSDGFSYRDGLEVSLLKQSCHIFSEHLKNSQIMDHICDHSPNHRHFTVTDLQVRVVRIAGGQCQLAIYF